MQLLKALLRLLTVFGGLMLIGWLMNGFEVPSYICIGTVLVCCYLVWVGSDGIALASVWVVSLMSIAAVNQYWLHDLPRPTYKYIPMLLLVEWLLALLVVWQLGIASDYFKQKKSFRTFGGVGLICLVGIGLRLGWQAYPEILLRLTTYLL